MKKQIKSIAIGAALFTLGGIGCSSEDSGPLGNVDSLIILQRPKRNTGGDIFQYTSYAPGARLVKLQPPTADGTLTTICCDTQGADFAKIDISGYDISFDAKSIVFAGKLAENQTYGLFLLQLSDGSVTQIATDPGRDYVSPIFLPADRIMFTTNAIDEVGGHQHVDEYERGVTTQLGTVGLDGKGMELGPRNLSHRTAPSLASDGRIIFTQWDHLGEENSGHLMFVNRDMQELREGFGKEGKGASNSTLKAQEISPGRFVAIATARDRTLNAGALIDIYLGDVETHDGVVSAPQNQSEAHSSFRLLTPDVPMDNTPSADTVGRYYDAYPLNAKAKPDLLVSWADGPVESGELATAGLAADFGVYVLDTEHQQRRPILDDHDMWDVFARPLRTRTAPNVVGSAQDPKLAGQTLIGSLNVYQSTLHTFTPGEIFGVRVMEGFSSEEGFRRMFGSTEFEGHANLGVAPVAADGSWSAKIPPNIPVHLQPVDVFGMSLFNEPVWFSGRPGEARMCGGCHEDRTRTTNVTPGQLDTFATGATDLMATKSRAERLNPAPATPTAIVGVPWGVLGQPSVPGQVQAIFDAKCVSCHGDDNLAKVASYTVTDATGAELATWTFNLTGGALPTAVGAALGSSGGDNGAADFTKSYFSMVGPNMEAVTKNKLKITGNYKVYLNPLDARGSLAIKLLNPTQLFPNPGTGRAFDTTAHLLDPAIATKAGVALPADLTPQEFYTLILSADMGGNFFCRENNPHDAMYQ